MTAPLSIRIRGLHKRYPRNRGLLPLLRSPFRREYIAALRGVDLELPRGGIYALLGPNGAGKTTLLKTLAGLLLPNAGSVVVNGVDVTARPELLRDHVSLSVCDERSFYWRLRARDNLRFFATLNGFAGAELERRVEGCLDLVGLGAVADRRYMELSSGMRQSLTLARGLLPEPDVLLMDEPTRSLDPEATLHIHEVIKGLQARHPHRIFLYSTHDLAEAESISSDVIVLRGGRVAMQQSLVPDDDAGVSYTIRTYPVMPTDLLDGTAGVTVLGSHGDATSIRVDPLAALDAVVDKVRAKGLRILEITPRRSSLGELYHSTAEAGR